MRSVMQLVSNRARSARKLVCKLTGDFTGFRHEQSRPDREDFVHFECRNVDPKCQNMPEGRTCCEDSSSTPLPAGCCSHMYNFDILRGLDHSQGYDTASIMHYVADEFALPGTHTLIPARPGVVVPTVHALGPSLGDRDGVCRLYREQCDKARQ